MFNVVNSLLQSSPATGDTIKFVGIALAALAVVIVVVLIVSKMKGD